MSQSVDCDARPAQTELLQQLESRENPPASAVLFVLLVYTGEVAEWFKATVLKTVVQQCTVSSNLTLSAIADCICFEADTIDTIVYRMRRECRSDVVPVGTTARQGRDRASLHEHEL